MANRLFLELTETASECSEDDSMFDSDGDTSDEEDFLGVPIWRTSVNISKGIIGEGLLSLPFGLAAGTGIFSGILIAIAFYAVMVYTFWTLGRVCEATGEKTHRGVGHRLTGGDIFGTLMTATNQVKTLFTCTAYALVIGKNAQDILAPLNWNSWISSRQGSWVTILFFVLVPLCLLRDLGKLAWTSFLGLVCETGVVAFMLLRFLDGSYQPGGTFYASQAPQTRADWGSSGEAELWTLSAASLTLVSAMSTAFLAHYNAPKFYHQLHRRSPRRFLVASSVSFTLALLLFVTCMVVGYLTFGTACSGNILHNYSDKDPLANAARLGMLVAVVCGFPIAFTGLRDASFSLCGCGSRRRVWVAMTLALLTLIGALGWSLDNLGILNSLGGAILGSMITLIFPGLLLTQASSFEQQKEEKETKQHFWRVEGRVVGRLLTLAGVLLMIFGTTTVVLEKFLHRKV